MAKKLSEMTLGELWELFPITLTEHRPHWADWYAEESRLVLDAIPNGAGARVSHVGSTAITGIWAKPIVDILLELPEGSDMGAASAAIAAAGYIRMSRSNNRASFNKGYTEQGFAERVFHLHLRYMGDCGELYFRDRMNAHPDEAREYERLKLSLWKRYEHDRDGYTDAKSEFVEKYTALARVEFAGRY